MQTVDVQQIVDAIDERTLLVPISHVLFRSAYILDVKPIIEKAHSVGAIVILDGYHATGIIPVDVTALNVELGIALLHGAQTPSLAALATDGSAAP